MEILTGRSEDIKLDLERLKSFRMFQFSWFEDRESFIRLRDTCIFVL